MSGPYDTKSNTVGDNSQSTTNQEPPPPYTPPQPGGSGSSTTITEREFREINKPYDGGATERSPLIPQQQSNILPSPQYAPLPNLRYPSGHIPTLNLPQPVALDVLPDRPAWTTCPHCRSVVFSKTEYEIGCCTYLSCLSLCCLVGTTICSFIPFCFNDFKDTVHYCPTCHRVMARFSRLKNRVVR